MKEENLVRNSLFTDEELKYLALVTVYGHQDADAKLRQIMGAGDAQILHDTVTEKIKNISHDEAKKIRLGDLTKQCTEDDIKKFMTYKYPTYKHTDDEAYRYCKDQILQEPDIPLHLQNLPYAEEIYDRVLKDPDFSGYEPRPRFVQYKKSQWICMGRDAYEDLQRQMQGWMADLQSELIELLGCVESMPSWDNLAETEKEK